MPLPIIILIVAGLFILYVFFMVKNYVFPKKIHQIAKWIEAGNIKQAIKALKSFIANNERNPLAHWYLGEAYYSEKRYELAIVEYKYVIKLGAFLKELSEIKVRKRLAKIYKEFNQLDEAQKEFILISNLNPNDFEVLFEIGELFYKRNLIENSVAYFQKVVRVNPQHSESYYYLGIIYFSSGRFEEANNALSKSVQNDQRNYKAHLYLALVYKAMGQFDSAIRELGQAERDPDLKVRAMLENGKIFYERDNLPKAIVELERALKFTSSEDDISMEIRYWLANCYEKNRDIPNAVEQWEFITQNRPSYRDVQQKLTTYADLRTDDRLKDFLTASLANFQIICKNLVNSMGYNITETMAQSDEGIDVTAVEAETKWRNIKRINVIIKIRREPNPIGEMLIRELHEDMRKNSANRGIIITASSFAPSALQYASTRPIDLIDKAKLVELLKKVEPK